MKRIRSLLIIIMMSVTIGSCEAKRDIDSLSKPQTLKPEAKTISDFELGNEWKWVETTRNQIYLIKSDEELKKIIVSENGKVPAIDFSKHTLIFVSGQSISGIESIKKSFISLGKGKYSLHISIKQSIASVITPWEIAVLVPLIEKNAIVELRLDYSGGGEVK